MSRQPLPRLSKILLCPPKKLFLTRGGTLPLRGKACVFFYFFPESEEDDPKDWVENTFGDLKAHVLQVVSYIRDVKVRDIWLLVLPGYWDRENRGDFQEMACRAIDPEI